MFLKNLFSKHLRYSWSTLDEIPIQMFSLWYCFLSCKSILIEKNMLCKENIQIIFVADMIVATLISEWLLTSAMLLVISYWYEDGYLSDFASWGSSRKKRTVNEDTEVTAIHCCS